MATDLTSKRRERFLRALTSHGVVKHAAAAAGITRQTAYTWRKTDPEFAEAWESALEDGVDELEAEAKRRALESSDVLLIFLLKHNRKGKYLEHFDRIERELAEMRDEVRRLKEGKAA